MVYSFIALLEFIESDTDLSHVIHIFDLVLSGNKNVPSPLKRGKFFLYFRLCIFNIIILTTMQIMLNFLYKK